MTLFFIIALAIGLTFTLAVCKSAAEAKRRRDW